MSCSFKKSRALQKFYCTLNFEKRVCYVVNFKVLKSIASFAQRTAIVTQRTAGTPYCRVPVDIQNENKQQEATLI